MPAWHDADDETTRRDYEMRLKLLYYYYEMMRGNVVLYIQASIWICKEPRGLSNVKRCRDEFGARCLCSGRGCGV